MPNWNTNRITFENLPQEKVEEIKTHLKEGNLLGHYLPEPDWANLPNSDGELPQEITKTLQNGKTYTTNNFPSGKNDDRWYSWRVNNWGVKWDIVESWGIDTDENTITFYCDTPWGPPVEALNQISYILSCKITNKYYEEGMDFWGVETYVDGERSILGEGDVSGLLDEYFKKHHPNLNVDDNEDEYYDIRNEVLGDLIEGKFDECEMVKV